jgi:class 3 adenylate cyclase
VTEEKDIPKVSQKIVLFFDLCSSTTILEALLRHEREKRWRDLLIALKNFLREEKLKQHFEIYKFIGDGWILLFDPDCSADALFEFLKNLCKKYDALYMTKVAGVLASDVGNVGITFGLEKGSLMRVIMNSQTEYIGRALNVAARLQAAIKDKDSKPQGKVLMSNNVYEDFKNSLSGKFQIFNVKRNLRNISDGENYLAKKVLLLQKPTKKIIRLRRVKPRPTILRKTPKIEH